MFSIVLSLQLFLLGVLCTVGYIDMRFKKKERVNIWSVVSFYIFVSIILIAINGIVFN